MPDFTGQTIDGERYYLDKLLGSGAYGKVYRAMDLKSPVECRAFYAIKCMPIYVPGTTKAHFQTRELFNHPKVRDHPNIVRYERHFQEEDWVYVVMELVRGGDLFAAITERHVFRNNDSLVKNVYLQIIDAVQYCHKKGIYHRDIKPENILYSEDTRRIKLADFGLSTTHAASAEYGCGSCYYMSPECIAEQKPRLKYSSKQTDVWSMGVILVNMISGRNPWRYATTDDQCFQAYLNDNDFLGNVLPISAEANAIIKRIFTIDPLRRITLEQLEEEIIQVHTFFRSQQQLKPLSKPLQAQRPAESSDSGWQTESEPVPTKPTRVVIETDGVALSSPILRPPATPEKQNNRSTKLEPSVPGPEDKPSTGGTSSAADSSKSSLAVKTPSVHAVIPVAIVRPSGAPDDDVEEALALPGSLLDKVLRSPAGKPKSITIKNGRNILRAAVQRIKDFSAPTSTSTGSGAT